jgi:hypothetical protein
MYDSELAQFPVSRGLCQRGQGPEEEGVPDASLPDTA